MKKNELKVLRLKLLNDIAAAKKALRGLEKIEVKKVKKTIKEGDKKNDKNYL